MDKLRKAAEADTNYIHVHIYFLSLLHRSHFMSCIFRRFVWECFVRGRLEPQDRVGDGSVGHGSMGHMGRHYSMGHMGHGSVGADP